MIALAHLKCLSCKNNFPSTPYYFYSNRSFPNQLKRYGLDIYCKDCRNQQHYIAEQKKKDKVPYEFWEFWSNKYLAISEYLPGFSNFNDYKNTMPQSASIYFFLQLNDFRLYSSHVEAFNNLYSSMPPITLAAVTYILECTRKYRHYFILEKKCKQCSILSLTYANAINTDHFLHVTGYNDGIIKPINPLNYSQNRFTRSGWKNICNNCLPPSPTCTGI